LNYAKDKYFSISEKSSCSAANLPSSTYPLLITDPAHEFTFRTALLNNVINGRYVVCAEPLDVRRVCDAHNNKIEVIGTQDLDVPKEVKVFVQSGSGLFERHQNKMEL
jgi:hypothetical protein